MANEENLKIITDSERARELQEKSVEARKRNIAAKKELREIINALFEKEFTMKNGDKVSGAEMLAMKQFEKASKGDTRAFEVLRDTSGQKPVQQLEVNTINPEAIREVEEMIKNAKTRDNKPAD